MFAFIKWALAALAVFSVATATGEQQLAMYRGAEAFGAAFVTACTRADSPCTRAIGVAYTIMSPESKGPNAPVGQAAPAVVQPGALPRDRYDGYANRAPSAPRYAQPNPYAQQGSAAPVAPNGYR